MTDIDPLIFFCKVDPTGWWEDYADKHGLDYDPERLIEACGLIPHWVVEYAMEGDRNGIKDHLDKAYGFGLYHIEKGEIDKDGYTYRYPEDEPLKPLISMNLGDEGLLLMYQYAIVAIPTPDGWFITRMD